MKEVKCNRRLLGRQGFVLFVAKLSIAGKGHLGICIGSVKVLVAKITEKRSLLCPPYG